MANHDALRAAVIGCGLGGRLSLDALMASPNFEPVAAADPAAPARRAIKSSYPQVRLFADIRDLLRAIHVDVICIAAPTPWHEPVASIAIAQEVLGLLLEKPLASSTAVAKALFEQIAARDMPMVVPHGMLVLPAPADVKRRIHGGIIGRIERVEVQNAVDLLNAGIHWLAYLLDVFEGDEPASIDATFDTIGQLANDGVQVESRGTTRITLQSGMQWVLHSGAATQPVSDVLPQEEQRGAIFRLAGTCGSIEFSAWSGSYRLVSAQSPHGNLIQCAANTDPSYHQIFLEQLADDIANGRPNYHSARLSLAALRLIERAYNAHDDVAWQLGHLVQE